MAEVLTFGETMMVLSPAEQCSLRYNSCFFPKIAGAESNTAIGICKLGHSAEWISCIGTDEIGQFVLNSVRAEGVSANLAFSAEAPTGIMFKQILPSEDTRVYYYRKNSAFTHFTPDNIPTTGFQSCKIFHATGITPVLSANSRDTLERMISICKQQDIAISFDPNIRLTLWRGQDYSDLLINIINRANYVMMGLKEAEYLFHLTDPVTIHNFLFKNNSSLKYLALKDGANGAYVSSPDEQHFIPPYPCRSIDPVGAGDAFNAGFLTGILEDQPLQTCGNMAAICGALCTQTFGDIEGLPDKQTLSRYLNNTTDIYR